MKPTLQRTTGLSRNASRVWLLVLLALLLVSAGVAGAGGGYAIDWWTVDGGGGPAAGGVYTLEATTGQPDAGALAGGAYTLQGGYWAGPPGTVIYLPLIQTDT